MRVLMLVALLLAASAPSAEQAGTGRLEGRRLADALRVLQERGLRIVFSSEIVTPDMRVTSEPRATAPRAQLDELLQAHGLKVEDGPGMVFLVVRAKPVQPDSVRRADDSGTGAIEGHVVDAATGSSLPDVLVQVVGSKRSARTDKEGRFLLQHVPSGA